MKLLLIGTTEACVAWAKRRLIPRDLYIIIHKPDALRGLGRDLNFYDVNSYILRGTEKISLRLRDNGHKSITEQDVLAEYTRI